jgi:hypothetical protein
MKSKPSKRGMTQAEYARHRGCDPKEVRKALKAGRIALERDGSIDPDKADRSWAASVNPASKMKPVPTDAVKAARDILRSAGEKSANGPMTFVEARTANEVIKAQLGQLRLREREGALVDRQKAVAAVFELAREVRGAIETFPARASAQIAAELGADEHATEQVLNGALRDLLNTLADVDVERVMAALSPKSG